MRRLIWTPQWRKRRRIALCMAFVVVSLLIALGHLLPPTGGTAAPAATASAGGTAAPATEALAGPADTFIGWTGAIAEELRICGLAAHEIVWLNTSVRLTDVFSMADTPTDGCDFAAKNISYDNVPADLPVASLTVARDKLVAWARTLADAYRNSADPVSSVLDQADQDEADGLQVIVAEGLRLHSPVDPSTLLPKGQAWDNG